MRPHRLRWIVGLLLVVGALAPATAQEKPPLLERLKVPPEFPGSDAPPIVLPDLKPENAQKRKEAIEKHFPSLPPLGDDPPAVLGPHGKPLSLDDLAHMARANNPSLRQAAADIDAARGRAIQAGLYPNPNVGFEGDVMNQGSTAGTLGGYIEQTIKTGGKLQLARAVAYTEVRTAELSLRKTEIDVLTGVRRYYFMLLVARENLRVTRAVVAVTDEVYKIQVDRLRVGQAASYEPLQARVLAMQARAALVQVRNRYLSAWRQLAAAVGVPTLPLTQVAGSLERPIPHYPADAAFARVTQTHTDVRKADVSVDRARLSLRLAEVTPIPDVDLRYMLQHDYTSQPNNAVHSVVVGIPVPVWDRNQGAIRAANAELARAADEAGRARNDLTGQLAQAVERYDNARTLVELYRDRMLPDQTRSYRAIYERYNREPDALNFNDVITAQQTLTGTVAQYLTSQTDLWDAVVQLANLLQLDDLDQDLSVEHGAPCSPGKK